MLTCIATVLRLIHVNQVFYSPSNDISDYVLIAESWLARRNPPIHQSVLFPPGLPALLAVHGALLGFDDFRAFLWFQAVLSGFVTAAVAETARLIIGRRAGVMAALLYAVAGTPCLLPSLMMTESLAMSLLIVAVWLGLRLIKTPDRIGMMLFVLAAVSSIWDLWIF